MLTTRYIISSFLLQHRIWIYLTLPFLFTYGILFFGNDLSDSTYPILASLLAIWALPYYFVSVFFLEYTIPRWISYFLYPLLSVYLVSSLPYETTVLVSAKVVIISLGIILPILAPFLQDGQILPKWSFLRQRLQRLPLFIYVVICTGMLAFLVVPANNYFEAAVQSSSWTAYFGIYFSTVLQSLTIYLPYYLIYHWHHHILFNELLKKRGVVVYGVGIALLLLLFVPIHAALAGQFPAVTQFKMHPTGVIPNVWAPIHFSIPITILLVSFPFIAIVEWYKQANQLSIAKQEKTAAELGMLKQQINPHFFFNTLNNLYAMSLTEDKETPEAILKLAELMRYVIYQGPKTFVPIEADIAYLKDYIALQMLRFHHDLDYHFHIDISDQQSPIAPLLLVMLVENAFKHGLEPSDEPGLLHLQLIQQEQSIVFTCTNSVDSSVQDRGEIGIGLENLRRRLTITYPEQHKLELENQANKYFAKLTITL